MKTYLLLSLFLVALTESLRAQDTILKNNGNVIYAKILEVGTNAISYKRADFPEGPTFIENKVDISAIKYRNGQYQEFVRVEVPQAPIVPAASTTSGLNGQTAPGSNNPAAPVRSSDGSNHYKIEEIDGKYTMNGQKLGRKGLDRELKKSKNPLVQASLKTAKLAKVSQKIVGITSIPSTVVGGVTSIITISQCVTAYQTGKITPQYYVNAGLSFLGTLTVPITSKYLKKQRDKLYGKTIDLYNMGN